MASPKMFAEVVIAGSYSRLSKATRGAEKEMKGFGKAAKKISLAVKAAWAGGIAIGLDFLWDGLKKVSKAAAEEAQSMAVLRHAMDKSWKATDKMSQQAEDYIKKMSYMTAIQDDKLRPAYAKIVRVTKNSTKAQRAFTMALDISAATGKDVNVVSQAMAKYLGGNKTALDKLVPGLKNAGDKMKYLKDNYSGAAAEVGNQKPFEKIQIIFDDISERLGGYILPYVQQFADWLAGPQAQKMVDDIFVAIQNFFDYLGSKEGKEALKSYVDGLIAIADAMVQLVKTLSENKWVFDLLGGMLKFSTPAVIGNIANGTNPFSTPPPAYNDQQTIDNRGRYGNNYIKVDVKLNGKDVISAFRREAGARGVAPIDLLK